MTVSSNALVPSEMSDAGLERRRRGSTSVKEVRSGKGASTLVGNDGSEGRGLEGAPLLLLSELRTSQGRVDLEREPSNSWL
jgi:hypothetical protein